MMKRLSTVLVLIGLLGLSLNDSCEMSLDERIDCGYVGINQQICEGKGCCWVPTSGFLKEVGANYPWCFYKGNSNTCKNFNWKSETMGFDDSWYQGMSQKYDSQLNVQDSGAVVAAPDQNTPGGSYYYAWMRDGALSMRTYMELNPSFSAVQQKMYSYTKWVMKLQNKQDYNVDVRIEPKFNIPSGDPYTGGWCRPQSDGPALRAYAMIKWAQMLNDNGQADYVRSNLWNHNSGRGGAINYDLAWVTSNWQSDSCDLWEEVRSSDIFWNLMSFRYTMVAAADFARQMGSSGDADNFDNTRRQIEAKIDGHWNGNYLYQSQNRPSDTAVIHALVSFPGYFALHDDKVIKTIQHLNTVFCREYSINQKETGEGQSGLLYGRYPGDSYAGGNPWVLLTSVNAEIYYQAAIAIKQQGYVQQADIDAWKQLVDIQDGASLDQVVTTLKSAGHSILNKIYQKVSNDHYRLDEQIDRNDGFQKSAKSLTWSYANVLRAYKLGAQL